MIQKEGFLKKGGPLFSGYFLQYLRGILEFQKRLKGATNRLYTDIMVSINVDENHKK